MRKLAALLTGTTLAVGLALAGGSAFAADLSSAPQEVVPAEAQGSYVSIFGGYAFSNTVNAVSTEGDYNISAPYNGGYIVGGAVGTHLMPNLRGEVELSYSSRSAGSGSILTSDDSVTETGSLSTLYLLGNLWFDLDVGGGVTPYIGGGVGAAEIMPNVTNSDGGSYTTDATALAAQVGAGIKFNIADNVAVDLGYRLKGVFNGTLTGTGTSGSSTLTGVSYTDQTVQLGVSFGF